MEKEKLPGWSYCMFDQSKRIKKVYITGDLDSSLSAALPKLIFSSIGSMEGFIAVGTCRLKATRRQRCGRTLAPEVGWCFDVGLAGHKARANRREKFCKIALEVVTISY